jgi:hypothetical protein
MQHVQHDDQLGTQLRRAHMNNQQGGVYAWLNTAGMKARSAHAAVLQLPCNLPCVD